MNWNFVKDLIGYRTLKTVIASVAAMFVAIHFGLIYATAAGIIAILSLQSTKKQSIRFAGKMIGAFLVALLIAVGLFNVLGYSPLIFGLFLLIFIPLSVKLQVQEGIIVSAVLITQLLIEKTIELSFILNQLALVCIGVSSALLLNLYMPSFEDKIKKEQVHIEQIIKQILIDMSNSLRVQVVSIKEEEMFTLLKFRLKQGREMAANNFNNSFSFKNTYYINYMDVRLQQLHCLQNMRKHFGRLSTTYKQTIMIADFTIKSALLIQEYDTAAQRIEELSQLRQSFTTMQLPQNREEFENRVMLYQFLNDLEEFLLLEEVLASYNDI
jgi:uncharacterized membrane protein YgaE (UPF0421/DUF939 family)